VGADDLARTPAPRSPAPSRTGAVRRRRAGLKCPVRDAPGARRGHRRPAEAAVAWPPSSSSARRTRGSRTSQVDSLRPARPRGICPRHVPSGSRSATPTRLDQPAPPVPALRSGATSACRRMARRTAPVLPGRWVAPHDRSQGTLPGRMWRRSPFATPRGRRGSSPWAG
jgi:hypothetical protein